MVVARLEDQPSDLTNRELQEQVMRLERTIFAGTSSHRDVVVLIDCERELRRRERVCVGMVEAKVH